MGTQITKNFHKNLANYFAEKPLYLDEPTEQNPNTRILVELPWQQTKARMWNKVINTLCNLYYIEARCRMGHAFELITDCKLVQDNLPENKVEFKKQRKEQNLIKKWSKALNSYSEFWSKQRKKTKSVKETLKPCIELPSPPPSCHFWTDEEIRDRIDEIQLNPNRGDRLNSFSNFISTECYVLHSLSKRPGFLVQHAWNNSSDGPVHDSAKEIISSVTSPVILRCWSQESNFNPAPAHLMTLSGHTNAINKVAISNNGQLAISSGQDNTIRVWDLKTGRSINIIKTNEEYNWINSFSVSFGGSFLVSVDNNSSRIWNLHAGECMEKFEHYGQINCCAVTPDGSCAVSNEKNNSVRVFLPKNIQFTISLNNSVETIDLICLSPDGQYAVTGSNIGTIRLWDITNKCFVRLFNNKEEHHKIPMSNMGVAQFKIVDLTYSPVKNQIITVDSENAFQIWNRMTGQCLLNQKVPGINCVAVTADARFAVTAGYDGIIRIWNIAHCKCIRIINSYGDRIKGIAITPDGRRALTGNDEGLLRLWNLESGIVSKSDNRHSGTVNCISITPRGDYIVTGSNDHTLRVFDTKNGQCIHILEGYDEIILYAKISEDGTRCFSAGGKGNLRVWDLKTGDCIKKLENQGGLIRSIDITNDGLSGITGGEDGVIKVWNLESGQVLHDLYRFTDNPTSSWTTFEQIREDSANVVLTPDGHRIISSGRNAVPEVWDIRSGKCLHTLRGHKGRMTRIIVTSDGEKAYSGGEDGTIRAWDLKTGRNTRTIKCYNSSIIDLVLSPDGRYIATSNFNGIIKIWEVTTARKARVLPGHKGYISSLLFTPDGKHIISSGSDQTIRIWDYFNGHELSVYASQEAVNCMVISTDGRTIFGGTSSGEVIFLEIRGIEYSDLGSKTIQTKCWDYEQILRTGLSYCLKNKGRDNDESLAHLEALVIHLESIGKLEEALAASAERDEVKARVDDCKREKDLNRWLLEARSGRTDEFDIDEGQELWCLEELIALMNKQFRYTEAQVYTEERNALSEKESRQRLDSFRRCFESSENANIGCVKGRSLQNLGNLNFVLKISNWLKDAGYPLSKAEEKSVQQEIKRCKENLSDRWEKYNLNISLYSGPDNLCDPIISRLTNLLFQCLSTRYDITLVEKITGYFSIARQGFHEQELLNIIADIMGHSYYDQMDKKEIVIMSGELKDLYADLMNLFGEIRKSESKTRLKLPDVIKENFEVLTISSKANRFILHKELANYYLSHVKSDKSDEVPLTDYLLYLSECVFHLIQGGLYEEAANQLCDFTFLRYRLRFNLLDVTLEDYNILNLKAPEKIQEKISLWFEFLREHAHLLRKGGNQWTGDKILLQLAYEHGNDSQITAKADSWITSSFCSGIWLRKHTRPIFSAKNSCQLVIKTTDTDTYTGIIELTNGRLLTWTQPDTGFPESGELHIWDSSNGNCLKTIEINSQGVIGIKQLDNTRLLALSSHSVQMLDIRTGKCIAVLKNDLSWVDNILLLPDGKILSWSSDGNGKLLWLWDSTNGKCLAPLEGHKKGILGAIVLRDGKIASWSWDGSIRVWTNDGRSVSVSRGHTRLINGVIELSDNHLLSWSDDMTLRIWSPETGKELANLEGHKDFIGGALELPDGNILSWCGGKYLNRDICDISPRIWDRKSGKCIAVLNGHSEPINGMQVLSDERPVSWSKDGTIRIWSGETGECLNILEGQRSVDRIRQLKDGRILSWSIDLAVWDADTGNCMAIYKGHDNIIVEALELQDGRILSFDRDGDIRIWNINTMDNNVDQNKNRSWIHCVSSQDYRQILSFTNNYLFVWDIQSGTCILTLDGHESSVLGAKYLPGDRVLSWGDKNPRLWDIHTGSCLMTLAGHTEYVAGMIVLADGNLLSWSADKTLRLWNSVNGDCLLIFSGHQEGIIGAIEISHEYFVSWSSEDSLYMWNITNGSYRLLKSGHNDKIRRALVLNSERMVTWTWDKTLVLYDLVNCNCIAKCKEHTGWIEGVLNLDSERFLSWSSDKTLRIWDTKTGSGLSTLHGHKDEIAGAAILSSAEILSWSQGDYFKTKELSLSVWDSLSGLCLHEISEKEAINLHPEWLCECVKSMNHALEVNGFFILPATYSIRLCNRNSRNIIASWHSDRKVTAHALYSDGTVVIEIDDDSTLHFIKLYNGKNQISLADLKTIFVLGSNNNQIGLEE